jgi:hypothetical protein
MKNFILIFVSLFFLNAQAQDATPSAKPATPGANDSSGATVGDALAKAFAGTKTDKQDCLDALKDKLSDDKENKDKIDDLEKEKVDDAKDLQEQINEKDAAITQADVDYKKERDDIMSEINKNEEEKDTTVRTLNDQITKQINALKTIVITNRNKVERDYQQDLTAAYAQCNIIAQKDLKDRTAADLADKQEQNKGLINSGGAGFNGNTSTKIRAIVAKGYKDCVTMAQTALKNKRTNSVEELKDAETEAQTAVTSSAQELNDYINRKYPKKAIELNEKLNTADQQNVQTKNKLAQEKQALQQALVDKMALLDQQIQSRNTEGFNKGASKDITTADIDEARFGACCTQEVKDGKETGRQVPVVISSATIKMCSKSSRSSHSHGTH